jgi:hypothetical protein
MSADLDEVRGGVGRGEQHRAALAGVASDAHKVEGGGGGGRTQAWGRDTFFLAWTAKRVDFFYNIAGGLR